MLDLEHFCLETPVLEPLENPFGTKVLPMFPGSTEVGWCAQGDDFRTFLGDFVAVVPQIEFVTGLNLSPYSRTQIKPLSSDQFSSRNSQILVSWLKP